MKDASSGGLLSGAIEGGGVAPHGGLHGARLLHHGLLVRLPEAQDVPEVLCLAAPDEAHAVGIGIAVEPVVYVLLVEQLHVLRGVLVQPVLHVDVVEERLLRPSASLAPEDTLPPSSIFSRLLKNRLANLKE